MADLTNTMSKVDLTAYIKFWIPITDNKPYMHMKNVLILKQRGYLLAHVPERFRG